MRILGSGDVHWSVFSSSIRKRGEKYSVRLENLIKSVNFVERTAEKHGVDAVTYFGDFFNSDEVCAEELTALKEIKWAKIKHYFLVGNHELGGSLFNSVNVFNNDDFIIVSEPTVISNILFLPYIRESDRLGLSEYTCGSDIIFSHNDLQTQYGAYKSSIGFGIGEIEKNCKLFINGHLHNGTKITDKIINIGNLTGQNYGEDAMIYSHNVMLIDTDNYSYEYIENPYAFNFYKFDLTDGTNNIDNIINVIKNNAVVSVKVNEADYETVVNRLELCEKIVSHRITIEREKGNSEISVSEIQSKDHIQQFIDFVKEKVGMSDIVFEELNEVCK